MQTVFDHSEVIVPDIMTFWFKPATPGRYVAGQFTELHLPHSNPDNRGAKRWFTLSSSPTEPLLGITTRLTTTHGSSFKRALARLKPGTPVQLAEPMGDFVLPKDPSVPLIFVAGGIGITPVRSMIKWLLDTGEQRNIRLLYAAASQEQLAFESLIKRYDSLNLTTVIGPLNADHVLETRPSSDSLIYLSGPENLVESLFKALKTSGIGQEQLVTDYFHGYIAI